jgi:hypothetical protein
MKSTCEKSGCGEEHVKEEAKDGDKEEAKEKEKRREWKRATYLRRMPSERPGAKKEGK